MNLSKKIRGLLLIWFECNLLKDFFHSDWKESYGKDEKENISNNAYSARNFGCECEGKEDRKQFCSC